MASRAGMYLALLPWVELGIDFSEEALGTHM